jgi:hypothetical protein
LTKQILHAASSKPAGASVSLMSGARTRLNVPLGITVRFAHLEQRPVDCRLSSERVQAVQLGRGAACDGRHTHEEEEPVEFEEHRGQETLLRFALDCC